MTESHDTEPTERDSLLQASAINKSLTDHRVPSHDIQDDDALPEDDHGIDQRTIITILSVWPCMFLAALG